jgi:hypothetical protein
MFHVRSLMRRLGKSQKFDLVHQMNPVFTGISLSLTGSHLPLVLGTYVARWPDDPDALTSNGGWTGRFMARGRERIAAMQQRRADALRNLADRTGVDEVKKLVAVLIQADRFGTSIAQSLRGHSEFMRVQTRQAAEEKAAKLGVKLVFPIFFFILPSMMVVAAGPGLLQIFKFLFPMMKALG